MSNFSLNEGSDRCLLSKPWPSVHDEEDLALFVAHPYLCDGNGLPIEGAFPFNHLNLRTADTPQFPHDRCGESEGLSMERVTKDDCKHMEDQSESIFSNKPDRTPKGAAVASAFDLRSIRLDADAISEKGGKKTLISSVQQVVFILADGGSENQKHCVMRFHCDSDKVVHRKLVERVIKKFHSHEEYCSGENI